MMKKNFTLGKEIYLIDDWYNGTNVDAKYLNPVYEGVYLVQP
jgi:hypothetical protein